MSCESTNLNFWFEKGGEIFADVNSPLNDKGVWTGHCWDGKKAVKVEDVQRKGSGKESKGNQDKEHS